MSQARQQPMPTQQMEMPNTDPTLSRSSSSTEQPKPKAPMTFSLRGGGTGEEICCGCCAACCACEAFECFECCKGCCE